MKTIVRKNTWLPDYLCGWGNGYVIIPIGHPLHGKHYDDIDVNVHGGLTFAEEITSEMLELFPGLAFEDVGCWMVGFDTAHYSDNKIKWNEKAVIEETERLRKQLESNESN